MQRIQEWPIVVDRDGVIIAGHTRLLASQKLGLEKVPVIVASDLTEEQANAYRLADNRTGEIAMWDRPVLDDELRKILDIDMMDFGFLEPEPEPEKTDDSFDPDDAIDRARSGIGGDEHPTMKPVPLMALLIRNSTRKGDIVLDLFGGSGSTLIACEQMGRSCRMMELDPLYCRVIIDRWEKLTGKKAEKVA